MSAEQWDAAATVVAEVFDTMANVTVGGGGVRHLDLGDHFTVMVDVEQQRPSWDDPDGDEQVVIRVGVYRIVDGTVQDDPAALVAVQPTRDALTAALATALALCDGPTPTPSKEHTIGYVTVKYDFEVSEATRLHMRAQDVEPSLYAELETVDDETAVSILLDGGADRLTHERHGVQVTAISTVDRSPGSPLEPPTLRRGY